MRRENIARKKKFFNDDDVPSMSLAVFTARRWSWVSVPPPEF